MKNGPRGKRNRVSSGYALHFAVDELIRFESEAAEEVLRSLIRLRADVHSRATVKRIVSKDSYEARSPRFCMVFRAFQGFFYGFSMVFMVLDAVRHRFQGLFAFR